MPFREIEEGLKTHSREIGQSLSKSTRGRKRTIPLGGKRRKGTHSGKILCCGYIPRSCKESWKGLELDRAKVYEPGPKSGCRVERLRTPREKEEVTGH